MRNRSFNYKVRRAFRRLERHRRILRSIESRSEEPYLFSAWQSSHRAAYRWQAWLASVGVRY